MIQLTEYDTREINVQVAKFSTDMRSHDIVLMEIQHNAECDKVDPLKYKYFSFFFSSRVYWNNMKQNVFIKESNLWLYNHEQYTQTTKSRAFIHRLYGLRYLTLYSIKPEY